MTNHSVVMGGRGSGRKGKRPRIVINGYLLPGFACRRRYKRERNPGNPGNPGIVMYMLEGLITRDVQ